MELQAVIGQLHLVEGVVQENTDVPGVLAQYAPKEAVRGRQNDALFIHLSLTGSPAGRNPLLLEILNLISQNYYKSTGSVTAALRRAILEANQKLLNFNMVGENEERTGAIMCAVLRGQELFMIQTGEAFALIGRNFGVERLPAGQPDRITPLGISAGLDLRFFHNWLEPGDMLLMTDPRLANLPSEKTKPALVDTTVEESLPKLKEIIGEDSGRLLLVEFTDEAPDDIPEPEPTVPLAVAPTPNEQDTPVAPPRSVRPRRQVISRRNPVATQNVQNAARQAGSNTAQGLSRATGWLAALMNRLRPAGNAQDESGSMFWPTVLAVAIPLIVAIIVSGVYLRREEVQNLSQIERQMQQNIGLAQQATTVEEERGYYMQVLSLADQAVAVQADNDDIIRMRQQAQSELDRLEDVTRLNAQLLYTYPDSSNMIGLALREGFNGDLFTLDGANNRVFRHETDEDFTALTGAEAEEILFGGQVIGSHVTGDIVDMMWRPRGVQVSEAGLGILDSSGALVTFYPSFENLRAVPLGLSSAWVNPVSITQFNERLYVLDPGQGQIWRYFPEGEGFFIDDDQQAVELPDLDQAVDTAIYSEDGSVIALYADGRLRRYSGGSLLWDESLLEESGLKPALVAPTHVKIVGRGLSSSIFVADPGSGRVIQLSLAGTFLAQFKAVDELGFELFANLGDFAVAEGQPLRLLVVTENALYLTTE